MLILHVSSSRLLLKKLSPQPLLLESSWKTAYLNVEVYEENDQCGHVGGLEHEAAKWESTWLHSCTKCMHNSEQKLNLWRKDHA